MILLFLGLALVLTTSSSLLLASGFGGEGDGVDESHSPEESSSAGEISGSISITSRGEVWITVLIDDYSILARLDVVKTTQNKSGYRFSIAAVDTPSGSWGSVSGHVLPLAALESRIVEFNDPEEAASKIIQLFDTLGVVISKESIRSIPYAISCGWKSPEECEKAVTEVLDEQ